MFAPSLFTDDLDHVLTHTRNLWEELRGRRIFITGGTGFFGAWLVESLLWANDQLSLDARAVVLSRDPEAWARKMPHLASHPALSFHAGDVRNFAFPEGRFSHVIHAATRVSAQIDAEDPLLMLETIVDGTRRALEFARHCGAAKFLLTSSGAVYGRQPSDLTHIPEDYSGAPDTMEPGSAYGQGKRLAEQCCSLCSRKYGLDVKIARCFAFVGPYLPLDAHFAIGDFIRDGLRGGPIVVRGDGTPYRSYLYAADLAIWLWTILFRGVSCRPYNTGSDADLTIADLAREVATVIAPTAEIRIADTPKPGRPRQAYVPSICRARDELGLGITIPLAEAIRRTGVWHRDHRQKA